VNDTPECPFKLGQTVAMKSFQTAAGKDYPRVEGLKVEAVKLEPCVSIPSYWRIKAGRFHEAYEGAARFFEAAP
jgi:hypothetical protein